MRSGTATGVMAATGLVLVGSGGVHLLRDLASGSSLHQLIVGGLIGGSGAGLLYAGYWHAERPFLVERGPRILGWTVTSTLLFAAVGMVSLYLGSVRVRPIELFEVLHLTVAVGLATGVYVGTSHARIVDTAESAARARARAEALESERERSERLNDLLRHYVLNGVNVITGNVAELRSSIPESEQPALDAVDRRARSMTTLVEHVSSLLTTDVDPTTAATVDLVDLVNATVEDVGPGATVTVETPDGPTSVRTSGALDDALYLLCDAVATVTERDGEITIRCESTGSNPTVSVAATPVDIPEPIAASPFEPVTDVGLKFFLARQLIDGRGDLRLVDCDDDELRSELAVRDAGYGPL